MLHISNRVNLFYRYSSYRIDLRTHKIEGLEEFNGKLGIDKEWSVYCFEPNSDTYNSSLPLVDNIKDKYLSFVHKNVAVMDYNGTMKFNVHKGAWKDGSKTKYISGYTTMSKALDINPEFDTGNGVVFDIVEEVICISILDIIESISKNDNNPEIYIKYDIEGSEFKVLPKLLDLKHVKNIKQIYIEWYERFWYADNSKYKEICNEKILIINKSLNWEFNVIHTLKYSFLNLKMNITFVTCFYKIKSKFDINTYIEWTKNFINETSNFNLVLYTNKESYPYIEEIVKNNSKVKIIFKELSEFLLYKYKSKWETNQNKNTELSQVSWELIMLWCEKINFVNEAYKNNYFNLEWYGWCDIGYFRNGKIDNWPNNDKILSLNKDKIYYLQVCDDNIINLLRQFILNINEFDLPITPIPANQISIAGGFFLIYFKMIDLYTKIFNDRIKTYFNHDYLIKDDQIIIIDSIIRHKDLFHIIKGDWFDFRTFLQ